MLQSSQASSGSVVHRSRQRHSIVHDEEFETRGRPASQTRRIENDLLCQTIMKTLGERTRVERITSIGLKSN